MSFSDAVAGSLLPDVLGGDWTAETIGLPPDHEGPVVATLVRRTPLGPTSQGAVLLVHGFADYFFHTDHADWWTARGWDVYALDLRKYGRSLRPHQTATDITDLAEYDAELGLAWWRVTRRDGHRRVVVDAHSTGGLVAALWADRVRPPELAGLVLNSPWFELQGAPWLRTAAAAAALDQLGRRRPGLEIPREVNGFYGRSLHRDHEGEWTYDLAWKPLESYPARVGWLRAVRAGHRRLQAGLDVDVPTLVLSSGRSHRPTVLDEDVHTCDIVLDVEHIRRWAGAVGRHVTSIAVPGARHDVWLSRPEARARAHAVLGRWLATWLEGD
ncbi:alpha/beta hydrolase [Nocardioides sp.]|uniref:alpha/beta hydrolase n=1 Tax=Nocardioides sp. TaxID=35761 RepID=UPI0035118ABF